MGAYADRPCGTLSSGQKQRANVARAFLHDPPLLILDEPTNALDVVSGQFIVRAIRQAREAGRAVLFSTHIMGEAEYLCDRIVLIHQGRVVDAGPLPDLLVRSGQANLTDAFLHYAGAAARAEPDADALCRSSAPSCVKELRETLRDRRTLLLTLGLPVLLYPLAILAFTRIAESGEDAIEAGRSAVAVWGTLPAPVEQRAGRRRRPDAPALGRRTGRRARRPHRRPAGAGSKPATTAPRRARAAERPAPVRGGRSSPRTPCSPPPARPSLPARWRP